MTSRRFELPVHSEAPRDATPLELVFGRKAPQSFKARVGHSLDDQFAIGIDGQLELVHANERWVTLGDWIESDATDELSHRPIIEYVHRPVPGTENVSADLNGEIETDDFV